MKPLWLYSDPFNTDVADYLRGLPRASQVGPWQLMREDFSIDFDKAQRELPVFQGGRDTLIVEHEAFAVPTLESSDAYRREWAARMSALCGWIKGAWPDVKLLFYGIPVRLVASPSPELRELNDFLTRTIAPYAYGLSGLCYPYSDDPTKVYDAASVNVTELNRCCDYGYGFSPKKPECIPIIAGIYRYADNDWRPASAGTVLSLVKAVREGADGLAYYDDARQAHPQGDVIRRLLDQYRTGKRLSVE